MADDLLVTRLSQSSLGRLNLSPDDAKLHQLQTLARKVGQRPEGLRLDAEAVGELRRLLKVDAEVMMRELALVAKQWATPPLSKYEVAAVGLTEDGQLLVGVNLEFPPLPLNQAVHAEQYLVARVQAAHLTLVALAVNAPPCGHCRQFLQEVGGAEGLKVLLISGGAASLMAPLAPDGHRPDRSALALALKREQAGQAHRVGLPELLPLAFGPRDLGVEGERIGLPQVVPLLLGPVPPGLEEEAEAALGAASSLCYAPYSGCRSGVALRTNQGLYRAGALECAAFNPTLSPLHAALVQVHAQEGAEGWGRITVALLAEEEGGVSYASVLTSLLPLLAPLARLVRLTLVRPPPT